MAFLMAWWVMTCSIMCRTAQPAVKTSVSDSPVHLAHPAQPVHLVQPAHLAHPAQPAHLAHPAQPPPFRIRCYTIIKLNETFRGRFIMTEINKCNTNKKNDTHPEAAASLTFKVSNKVEECSCVKYVELVVMYCWHTRFIIFTEDFRIAEPIVDQYDFVHSLHLITITD